MQHTDAYDLGETIEDKRQGKDSGLNGPGFNPRSSQEKVKYIFSCLGWLHWNL